MIDFKGKLYKVTLIFYTVLSIASTLYLIFRPEDKEIQQRFFDTQQELDRIQHFLEEQDSIYNETIFSLQKENDSLTNVLELNEARLSHARSKTKVLSTQLTLYMDRYESDTTLYKDESAFDSLSGLSREYLIRSMERDSLCDDQLSTMEDLLQVKDSLIDSGQDLIGDYKSSVDDLLKNCSDLNAELDKSQRKLQKRTRLVRVLTGAVIASVGTTVILISQ